jgi:beta-phosphoglucomutase
MLSAVIFDFDGIVVNTEPIHYQAFQEVLRPLGLEYSWDCYLESYIGFDDRDAFRESFKRAGKQLTGLELKNLIRRKAAFFQSIVRKGITPYPGVPELIKSLSGTLPIALCSGALKDDIEPILDQLGIEGLFDVTVTADEVSKSKPDPESYLLAIRRLTHIFPEKKIHPRDCIAIEDTPAGIASAVSAGLNVMAVTNSYQADRLEGAMIVTDSLMNIDISCLKKFMDD